MAHMGPRYGDDLVATAGTGEMEEVARRDSQRIERVLASDADGFWEQVQEGQDDLKWCGSSPLYTFLRAVPGAKGAFRGYEQWNIDDSSVVTSQRCRSSARFLTERPLASIRDASEHRGLCVRLQRECCGSRPRSYCSDCT